MIKFWLMKHIAEFLWALIGLGICAVVLVIWVLVCMILDKRKEKKDAAHKKDHR